ncbi:hypothetical protein A3SI_14494 [Nitritalea halalkaliphila LW7]|uniref:Uncharacterized protein n=1 Tax=Nitritalea halalkaliphila LW7 TaxID=1189621 RepID=I5BZQ2_9BACT|nr:hypothetical protein A3SI_14494 [Nitritalea halalkaliphila LW7]
MYFLYNFTASGRLHYGVIPVICCWIFMKQCPSPILFYLSSCLIGLVLGLSACSSERNTFTNRLYHNTTARFNAYFLADSKIKELEQIIATTHQEDYTTILPIFYPIDSAIVEEHDALLEDARKLASKAIDWHRISKWVDDSYLLLGIVDYYRADFDDAINTFKYINVTSKDDALRHRALIQLLRAFIDLDYFEDATFVIDYLSKEGPIADENRFLLYKTLAYYYDKRNDLNGKIGALDQAVMLASDKKEKSRLNFILAQLYEEAGIESLAYSFYREAQKGNPPYERYFFAQLYAQKVADINRSKDFQKIRSYYDELFENSKNVEFRDVILYERALFELKQDDLDLARTLLRRGAAEQGKNKVTKGYIYEKLGTLSFEVDQDYRAASYYYDSALLHFRKGDAPVAQINARHAILHPYVKYYETVQENDSLLRLATLSPKEQEAFVDKFIAAEEERLIREAERKVVPKSSSVFDNLLAFGGGRGGGANTFYFENPVAMQQGAIEFNRVWGIRPVQDNWRRSAAQSFGGEEEPSPRASTAAMEEADPGPLANLPDRGALLDAIPNSPRAQQRLKTDLEDALFELGKLLHFSFKAHESAIDNLEKLLQDFPETSKRPETYYTLYLAHRELGKPSDYQARLNAEFPRSPFTFSVNNPNQPTGNLAYLESSRLYDRAYTAYQERAYEEAKGLVTEALEKYPLTRNTDRLVLLDIMLSGKLESEGMYQYKLEKFIGENENQDLVNLARKMLRALIGDPEEPEERIAEALPQAKEPEAKPDTAVVAPVIRRWFTKKI